MATPPKSSTVVVHAVVDGKHSAMIFTEADFRYEVTGLRSTPENPMWREDVDYVISGAGGYVFREGDDPTQVYVAALAHQAEETAKVRRERDEARRERDAALREAASLRESILRTVDPDSSGDEDEDYCEQCNDYHDWGEED